MALSPTVTEFIQFMVDQGNDREKTLELLVTDPTAPERMAPVMADWKAQRDARAEAEKQAAHAATPEGRREAALAAAKVQAERARARPGRSHPSRAGRPRRPF